MKKIIILFFALYSCLNSFCQDDDILEKTYYYQFNIPTPVFPCDILGEKIATEEVQPAPALSTFTLIGKKGDYYIISFGKWDKKTDSYKKFNIVKPELKSFLKT